MTLATQFAAYAAWRSQLATGFERLREWLADNELGDAQSDMRLAQLGERLREDRLNVAFVAEFSRGKSELINAIFFADYGNRMLPSSAGRTTMCPTELMFDPAKPPRVELLPIQTRTRNTGVSEYKRFPEEWTVEPLDVNSAEAMQETLRHVSEVIRVDRATAEDLGFAVGDGNIDTFHVGEDGLVEIPRWRHAIINFPHPLLKQGLVILDTPGLNAIGTEPELTLNMLPSAHAVLFLLSADTGVTKSDIEIWRRYIAPVQGASRARLVVLNKIDGLWDDLRSEDEIEAEIAKQVAGSATLLDLPPAQVYPVSAQKALVAKVKNDPALLARSRLPLLESALSQELIPCKQALVGESTQGGAEDVVVKTTELLETRIATLQDQIDELEGLRGKNRDVIQHMMIKANADQQQFERGLQQFNALRSVFSKQVEVLRRHLSMRVVRQNVRQTRLIMEKSRFSTGLREAMGRFFRQMDADLKTSSESVREIRNMMTAMYRKFSDEHGLAAVSPPNFSLRKYRKEMTRLEGVFDERFNSMFRMLTVGQQQLTARFFETLASEVVRVFELANRETEAWLKALIAPMETQVREHKIQLKRRIESVSRIHAATETLDERIAELEANMAMVSDQMDQLARINTHIGHALSDQPGERRLFKIA